MGDTAMNRAPVLTLVLGAAVLAAGALISGAALASGAPRYDARSTVRHEGCAPAAESSRPIACRSKSARLARDKARALSMADMIYLHRAYTGAAVPVSAGAAWSLALSEARPTMSDARPEQRLREEAVTQNSGERVKPNVPPVRKRNPA